MNFRIIKKGCNILSYEPDPAKENKDKTKFN